MRKDGQSDGWTKRHDEDNSRFSQFCERAPTNIFNGIKNRSAGVPPLTSALYYQQSSIKVDRRVNYLSTDNLNV
jgi:hypothetical protein